jgi:Fe2+ or Zn2+ uptake regulation protein
MGYTEKGIGYQHRDTSLAAAEDNEGNKVTLREQVYRLLLQATAPLSTEQVARELTIRVCSTTHLRTIQRIPS